MPLAADIKTQLASASIPTDLHESILGSLAVVADLTPKAGGSPAEVVETVETRRVALAGLPGEQLACVNLGTRGWLCRWERQEKGAKQPTVLGIFLLAGPAGSTVFGAS